jgi:hypothetical protein
MTKQQLRRLDRLNHLRAKVEASTYKIGRERDKLRDYIDDINAIISDADQADGDLESAAAHLEQAAQTISQLI